MNWLTTICAKLARYVDMTSCYMYLVPIISKGVIVFSMWWGDNFYCTCTFFSVIHNIHRWVFILVYLWSSMLTSDVASNGDTCSPSMSSRSCSNSESCSDKSSHFSSSCSCIHIHIQIQNDQELLPDQSDVKNPIVI